MRRSFGAALLLSLASALTVNAADVVEYYHLDAIGNVRLITDEDGAVVERHDYYPFGEECTTGPCASNPGAGAGNPRKFTAKERDVETGLNYFGARYYGSGIGRFTTVDPSLTIGENSLDPQRWNRYAYGRNNPFRFVDADGRDWLYRTVMGEQYVQQYGDRSSFSVIFEGISGDVPRAGPAFQEQIALDATIASMAAGLLAPAGRGTPAPQPKATAPYSRALYGGSQTNSPAARAARAAGEGQPCPSCGETQIGGTRTAPSPQHDPPLVKHYYDGVGKDMTQAQRATYAKSPESLKGTQCRTCQRREGGRLSHYSKQHKALLKERQRSQ